MEGEGRGGVEEVKGGAKRDREGGGVEGRGIVERKSEKNLGRCHRVGV